LQPKIFKKFRKMINRRLIRVKTLQALYSYYQSGDSSIDKAEKELSYSITKTYDLYYFIILLLLDLSQYAKNRIEVGKSKLAPTYDDLNPNTKFINNKVIEQLRENEQLKRYLTAKKMSWVNYPDIIKNLYNALLKTEQYKIYTLSEERSYDNEKKILIFILNKIFDQSEDLFTSLEEQSIYWNDNIEFAISMVVKTIKKFSVGNDSSTPLMAKYKNEEDEQFLYNLIRKTTYNHVEYKELINENIKNWDIDRLAFIDTIILQMALCEIKNFPEIPLKVTLNEYIEISKYYSTEKSSNFINGILHKLIKMLKADDQILKVGRGLLGDEEFNEVPIVTNTELSNVDDDVDLIKDDDIE